MKTIQNQIYDLVVEVARLLEERYEKNVSESFVLEHSPRAEFGDYATNFCMVACRSFRQSPLQIAEVFVSCLQEQEAFGRLCLKVDIQKPGFVNFFVKNEVFFSEMDTILAQGSSYFKSSPRNRSVCVEFVSANPTGPLHVGHARGAVIGDVLSSFLSFRGYQVTRQYYVNDAGNQMVILGRTAHYWINKLQGVKDVQLEADCYQGEYIKEIVESLMLQEKLEHLEDIELGRKLGEIILKRIEQDLDELGVQSFDEWFSEKSLFDDDRVSQTLKILRDRQFIKKSEGAEWFLSSLLSDDKDRVLIKSDGFYTYLASDLAFHLDKCQRFDEFINIWGADHHGYVARICSGIKALGDRSEKLTVILCQLVRLTQGGEPCKLSTRSGDFVELSELVRRVGCDVCRFFFLESKSDTHYDFDLDRACEMSIKNPVYYIQYAYARICRLREKLSFDPSFEGVDWRCLISDKEKELMKKVLDFSLVLDQVEKEKEVYYLSDYMLKLAGLFHSFYRSHSIAQASFELGYARWALVNSVRVVLEACFLITGIDMKESM